MRLVRTMMALMIALSVAMLPAAVRATPVVQSTPQATTEATAKDTVMASDMSGAMDECCPHHAKAKPCDQSNGQCPMAFCAIQAVSLAVAAAFHFDSPMGAGHPLPIPEDQVLALHSSSPPFRPPRV